MGELQRILYVEDDPGIREIVTVSLTTLGGMNVLACASGEEALARAEEYRPDLLLLDYMMPDMDGVSTLQALRQLPATAQSPAIFVTAVTPGTLPLEREKLGVIGLISKPFDPFEMPNMLLSAWQKQS